MKQLTRGATRNGSVCFKVQMMHPNRRQPAPERTDRTGLHLRPHRLRARCQAVCADLGAHGAGLSGGHGKHSHVQNYDDGNRENARQDEVDGPRDVVDEDHALSVARVILPRLRQAVPREDAAVGDGPEPTQAHAQAHSVHRDSGGVVKRVANGHVAVHGYEHHVAHGGRGDDEGHVVKQRTRQVTQKPAGQLEDDLHRQQQEAHN
ncbi:hypothetical protein EYF80_015715 [Liparis tanakae]|uniref:Uncharacterized protein n=1 Tax=Liparis tanakae TaxID=230148 RepID=A0A4Z2I9N1_9TELE|nr:hypothetical protein EYF80_015715 [Liparis tanakae]